MEGPICCQCSYNKRRINKKKWKMDEQICNGSKYEENLTKQTVETSGIEFEVDL